MEVQEWITVIDYNAKIYGWMDNIIVYQALNKLKGAAKIWYNSYIETEMGWATFTWDKWKQTLSTTFKSTHNAYQLIVDLINHRPSSECSLYDFHFKQLAKINKLKLNFSESDKVSLILGAINDIESLVF